MNYLEAELIFIRWIQSFSSPFLDLVFRLFTFLGDEVFIILFFGMVYWCLDNEIGKRLAFLSIVSLSLGNFFKDIFRAERPIGQEGVRSPGAERVKTASSPTNYPYSYSFPSGHSQFAAGAFGFTALTLKRGWVWILCSFLTLMVGLSRIYLGVHYPRDVLVGFLLGGAVTTVGYYVLKRVKRHYLIYTVTFLLLMITLFFANSDDTVKSLGAMAGFVLGVFTDERLIHFKTLPFPKTGRRRHIVRMFIRLVGGGLLLLLLKLILEVLLPVHPVGSFLEYLILIWFAIGGYVGIINALNKKGIML